MNKEVRKLIFSRRKVISLAGIAAICGIGGTWLFRHFSSTVPMKVESFITEGNGDKKNILILAGSARAGGNSDVMAQTFAKGAKESGHKVVIFNCANTPINGCLHCDECWSTGKPCIQEDNFTKLAQLLEMADMLVLASPLYWYNFSGQLKCAIDRLYPWSQKNCPAKLPIRETMLLMCGESHLPRSFVGAAESYRQIIGLKGWKDRGRLFAIGINKLGAMEKSGYMEVVEKMGRLA